MILNFRLKLTLYFGAFFILFGVLTTAIIQRQMQLSIRDQNGHHLFSIANAVSNEIKERLGEREREMKLLANSPVLIEGNKHAGEIDHILNSLRISHDHYLWIGIANSKGVITNGINGIFVGDSAVDKAWFQKGKLEEFIGVHELILDVLAEDSGEKPSEAFRFIDFSTPIFDHNREQTGVLAAIVSWDWMQEVLNRQITLEDRKKEVEVFVINEDNDVLFSVTSEQDQKRPTFTVEATKHQTNRWENDDDFQYSGMKIELQNSRNLHLSVIARQSLKKVDSEIKAIKILVFQISLIALIILFGVSYWVARQISAPIETLSKYADSIVNKGAIPQFESISSIIEINKLSDAIKHMLHRLVSAKQDLEDAKATLENTVEERTTELMEANQRLESKALELDSLARTDQLTKLTNRRASIEMLETLWNLFKRNKIHYVVIMVDIDFFKKVNDSFGHDIGDLALSSVARLLESNSRKTDLVSRYGGEEFLICLPGTDLVGAINLAEKIRAGVEANEIYPGLKVTVSLGIADCEDQDEDEMGIVKRADMALYEAKGSGRNRFCVAQSPKN